MYENKFSAWKKWDERNNLDNINFPGVYAIALSESDISNEAFVWKRNIIYLGMTNAISGLKGRLKAFDNTISGKRGHGGADRVRYKYQDYKKLTENLYVSVSYFKANVKSETPEDLNVMGDVVKFEYSCFAEYIVNFGELPEFNNKKTSPKFSLTYGRKNR